MIAWKLEEFSVLQVKIKKETDKKVGSIIDVCIKDTDISIPHSIKSESAILPIIVKFIRRRVRDDLNLRI